MYSAAAKNAYVELVKTATEKLASTYGVELQKGAPESQPEQGVKDEASPKR